VFYGLEMTQCTNFPYLEHCRKIARHEFRVDEPARIGRTVFVVEKHPTAFGTTTEHWMDLGRRVHALSNDGAATIQT